MKNITKSLLMITAVAAIVIGGTIAYFSDTETSTNNTFTAGEIDLSLGSQFNSVGNANGGPATNGMLTDNNGRTLFTFNDLKPGDKGTATFHMSVNSNDAYACAKTTTGSYDEHDLIDPEEEASDATTGAGNGELQKYLQFATFADLNKNDAFDAGEPINVGQYGGDSNGLSPAEVTAAGWVAVADSSSPNTWLTTDKLVTGQTYNAGMLYCFGNFDLNGACTAVAGDQNDAQTDSVSGSIEFFAVQTRNNLNFTCASKNPQPTRYTSSVQNYSPTGWAGWSCPAGTHAVGGGVIENAHPMGPQGIAQPGAIIGGSTYPTFPHYTFGANETGYVAQNGGTSQTARIYVDCLPN